MLPKALLRRLPGCFGPKDLTGQFVSELSHAAFDQRVNEANQGHESLDFGGCRANKEPVVNTQPYGRRVQVLSCDQNVPTLKFANGMGNVAIPNPFHVLVNGQYVRTA